MHAEAHDSAGPLPTALYRVVQEVLRWQDARVADPVVGHEAVDLIGASVHHGGLGKEYRSQLWRWVIYILIFGLLPFFAIDNAAHIGGLVSGLVLGYFVPEGEPTTRSSENLWNALAVLSVLIIAGSFVLMALQMNQHVG